MTARIRLRGKLSPWQGRVYLAAGRALYLGPVEDTTPHAHHALQVSVGLGAPVRLRRGDGPWREYEAAIVPPDVPHQLGGGGSPVLLLYVEPESADGRHWLLGVRSDIRALDSGTVAAVRGAVCEFASSPFTESNAPRVYAALLRSVGLVPDAPGPMDSRMAHAVRRLRDSHEPRRSLVDLASDSGLSPSRFRHLFRQEIGMSAQSYIVWLRLCEACTALARGSSLSDAALRAGFSDAAHFTRTFRRTFGLAPSQFTGRLTRMGTPPRIHSW